MKARCLKVAESEQFSITYKDDGGDLINISDDEDLQEAYTVANEMGGKVSFLINPRESNGHESTLISTRLSTRMSTMEDTRIEDPMGGDQINSSTMTTITPIQATIKEAKKVKEVVAEQSLESESDSSDSEVQEKKKKNGKKNKIPKKAFKKLIQKELEKYTSEMFSKMKKEK